ncbi:MAG: Bug family tripartite tricarboxylate transporter substrate binding protein [Carbonactinosporaceae bacterium]
MRSTSGGAFGWSIALMGLLLTGCAGGADTGSGDGGAASLEGETVDLVVPYEPGGGYDTYARLLSPYLEECLGATIVVRNEPGAGGLLATSKTFVAPPDSHRMLMANTVGVVSSQLGGVPGAKFDARKFSWLGRISAEPNVLVVAADSDFESFEDLRQAGRPVRFVATGPGSNEYANSAVLPEIYGFEAETITGFEGSDEARAAVLSGDADAHILPLDSQIEAIEAGDVKPLLVIGKEPHEAIPDVPTVADFPVGDDRQAILDALVELVVTGRSLAGPPGMDRAELQTMREGVACALRNEDLLAEAEKQQRDIDPLSGEETADVVDQALASPAEFRELVE